MRYLYVPAIVLLGVLAGCDADKTLKVAANDYCSVDSPTNTVDVVNNKPFEPWGWAYNVSDGSIPKNVSIEIISSSKDVVLTAPVIRSSRPDVAKVFGKPDLEMAGFGGNINISALKPGVYGINVIQEDGPRRYVCKSPVKFKVVAPKA
ncbi:hypothetical protein HX787_06705 [Pseudomonas tolaasii]|uniref:Lipoprotein n=2 Tax=Pseudomonas tolaasii TaxID=29442 RepID=A0A7Y8DQW7_PSETO|nr:hypothetical protein [Pseudomonas tolaasii]ARB27922.1 hypothetical protein B5P22_11755 [Pseudomonas tolaasii]KAB0477812.1 hypothetical protein F7R12_00705 [Pseudomonas tolaasii]MBW1248162.1 hypothetical protein [Pseudomonas tolaasii]MBW4795767.1 hypothetical protein [Pseudomonas tolaasii]MBY8940268.1 hypothetical protein [Pseudomonas tolaasii]